MAPALAPLCDVAGIAFQKCSFQLTWSTLEVTGVPWRYLEYLGGIIIVGPGTKRLKLS
jgi:hypothetical protein